MATTTLALWVAYVCAVSAVCAGLFGYDKWASSRARARVPEQTLLAVCLLGGSPAGLVVTQLLRHKTRKTAFRAWFWAIVGVQILALGIAWVTQR